MDLDDFKAVNDKYGHEVGDSVLCEVAQMLKGALRESDVISRIGGDEYAIILPNIGSKEKIDIIAKKILKAFERKVYLQSVDLQIKASIGFSIFPKDGDNIDVLLRKADQAMYIVKDTINENYCIYNEDSKTL